MIPSILKQFVQWTLAVPLALILMVLLEDVAPNGQWAGVLVPVLIVAVLTSRWIVDWAWKSSAEAAQPPQVVIAQRAEEYGRSP